MNASVTQYTGTLLEQFIQNTELYGDSIAVQNESRSINYAELKVLIERVSGFLKSIGIKQGDRVALVIGNSIDYVIAFYAIWKAGGIVIALSPQAKFHEIEKVVQLCRVQSLLINNINHDHALQLKSLGIHLMTIMDCKVDSVDLWKQALAFAADNQWLQTQSSSIAQIIYTSGTTGNPKGVMLSHGNLLCNTLDIIEYLELTRQDTVLNVLPFHYSYGNSVLHTHLCVGGSIFLGGSMAYPQEIVNSMRKFCITGFCGVPSTYNLLLSHSDWSKNPPPLRYITQAGGPMGKVLTKKLLEACDKQTQLFVMYGQTEASARISWLPPVRLKDKLSSVGIPLASVSIEIRDQFGKQLPNNQKGEVNVSGPSIMLGYWENSIATEQVLNDGWLKTGDMGYIDDDGYIFLLGRNSDMIKVGAHRINPHELEEIINKLNFVSESVIVGIEDELLGQKLHAFIVGDKSKENLFILKKHCNEYLSSHKIPHEITWTESLPKTASGKIKRYLLENKSNS